MIGGALALTTGIGRAISGWLVPRAMLCVTATLCGHSIRGRSHPQE
jgi:hypothetical protein